MRRTIVALLSVVFLSAAAHPVSAQKTIPTVTIMLSSSGELESDLEAIMKMGGKEAAEQWPTIQAILPAFNAGIDPIRPIRVDIIFGKVRDYRISIPYTNQKQVLGNIHGFIGGRAPKRIGSGIYALDGPAFKGTLRDNTKIKYVILAADKNNIPANFDPLPDLQPLLDAGYDLAASVKNTAEGAEDRKKAIGDLREELLGGLKKSEGESDLEFKIRTVGLVHQLEELERLFADSESLVLGWTTDGPKKEARMDLELTALPGTDLEKSIVELGAKPSLFSSAAKSAKSMFFGRVNHSLDEMRKAHLAEMLTLLADHSVAEIDATDKIADDGKSASKDAATAFFEMLKAGSVMGVFDGFADINYGDEGRSIVGTIRAADGTKINGVLASLKAAGWDVELAEASAAPAKVDETKETDAGTGTTADTAEKADAKAAPAEAAKDKKDKEVKSEEAASKPAAGASEKSSKEPKPAAEKPATSKPEVAKPEVPKPASAVATTSVELAIHKVKVPAIGESDFQNLFGENVTLLVAGTANGVYYAAGPGAEERLRKAVAETGEDQTKNDGTFIEVWAKLGPWLEYLKERRERREAGEDLSKLTKEEQIARKERAEFRDMAIKAFSEGQDTIHMQLKSDQKKVTGLTIYAEGILRFVGRAIANVAETKLQ
ncbi:MAG: hypothetical protein HQ518_16985 [Rhodopirellula sp.]|nr:hypothetical protein [Rhodopirellula sp.]